MYPISDEGLNKETEDAVYFFTTVFSALDNFSAHVVHIWDKDFPTVEHAFQWKKFSISYPEIANAILNAKSPHVVKEIADANKGKIYKNWREDRLVVMEEILRAKAEQHPDVKEILEKTGAKKIVENSPFDSFWGAGPDGKGGNNLGKLWMKIRDN